MIRKRSGRPAGHDAGGVFDHGVDNLAGLAAVAGGGDLAAALTDQRGQDRGVQAVK